MYDGGWCCGKNSAERERGEVQLFKKVVRASFIDKSIFE